MKHRGFPRASAHCRAREKAVGTGPGKCYTVRRTVLASTYRERIRHFDFHCCRLGRHRWLSAGHAGSRFVFPEPLGEKHGRLLRLGPQRFLVVGGTSMVATTFAADTPLVVTGLVYRHGIAGNWFWWSFLPSGMMTVFLFARLWRRSGLLTDVQFAEMRYAGKPAAFLRGFRALYLG